MPPKAKKKPAKKSPARTPKPKKRTRSIAEPLPHAAPLSLAPASEDGEAMAWFLAAVFAAFYWFDWLLVYSDAWPVSSASHYKVYAFTLFGVLPLSLLSCATLRFFRSFLMRNNENLIPALLSIHTLFWTWVWWHPTDSLMSLDLLGPIRWSLPLLSLLALAAAQFSGTQRLAFWSLVQRCVLFALPLLSLLFLWHFKTDTVANASTMISFALIAAGITLLLLLGRNRPAKALDWLDSTVGIVIVLTTVFTVTVINYYHQNFYLGPVREVLNGRSLLVNVDCQYGVAVIYFLAAAMKLLGMKPTFHAPDLPLDGLDRGIVPAALLGQPQGPALAPARGPVPGVHHLPEPLRLLQRRQCRLSQHGPLRFGLPILMLVAAFLRRSKNSGLWAWIEYGLLGLSSIWSLETFIYCLSAWGFALGAEALGESEGIFGFLGHCLKAAVCAAAAVAAAFAALYLLTYVRADVWPNWSNYLYFMNLYSGTFPNLPLQLWSPWILLPGAVCLGLLASALRTFERKDLDAGHYYIVGVSGAAAAEFSYYIMRSHLTNLSNVAPLFLVLFFYWLDRALLKPSQAGAARWTALPVAFFVLLALHWFCLPVIESRYEQSILAWMGDGVHAMLHGGNVPEPVALTQIWNPRPLGGARVEASLRLIQRYAPDQKQIALFTPEMEETYALSGKGSPYAVGTPIQDLIGPSYGDGPIPVNAGDVILLFRDKDGGYAGAPGLPDTYGVLQRWMDDIKRHYTLVPLEMDPSGIWAVRLAPLGAAPPAPPAKG